MSSDLGLAMFGNRSVVLAILFSTVYFFLYSSTLSWAELSYAQPLNALTFVFAALFARFWLHEGFSLTRSLGVVTIIVGVILISWDQRPAPALTASTSSPFQVASLAHFSEAWRSKSARPSGAKVRSRKSMRPVT